MSVMDHLLIDIQKQVYDILRACEDLIESNESQSVIEQNFEEARKLISKLEEDESLYGICKYRFHIKLACYLNSVGKVTEGQKNMGIAKRFEQYVSSNEEPVFKNDESSDEPAVKEPEFESFSKAELDKSATDDINELISNLFSKLNKKIFSKDFLDSIETLVLTFVKSRPSNFDEYLKLYASKKTLECIFTEVTVMLADNNEDSDAEESLAELKYCLFHTNMIQIRIDFIRRVLKLQNAIPVLFNVNLIDENILRQFRKLSLHFHPDRIKDWLPPEYLDLANEFFVFINELKEKLLKNHSKTDMNEHLKGANRFWTLANDYKNCLKGDYEKLVILKKSEILDLHLDVLRTKETECLNSAYSQYKVACKMADNSSSVADQVKLRGYLALVLYRLGKDILVSQLYALSSLRLINKYSHVLTIEDLTSAKNIYDKVTRADDSVGVTKKTATASSEASAGYSNNLSLVSLQDSPNSLISSRMSYDQRQQFDNSISDHLNETVSKLIVQSDRELIKYQANQEEILRTKTQGILHRAAGVSLLGAGAAGATAGAWALQAEIAAGTALALGPIAWIGFGFMFIGTGIYAGYELVKRSNTILEEPKIREKLNEILKNALTFYDKNMYNEFFHELTKEYATGKRLLNLESLNKSINTEVLISTLIKHGFRPDGVAYLLNLIGEVLIGGRLNLADKFSSDDLKNQALRLFDATLDESLLNEAKNLDDRIKTLRLKKRNFVERNLTIASTTIKDFYSSRTYTSVAREYVDDAKSMSFKFRLEEMRNIARLNKAIMRLFKNKDDEIALAEKDIKEVRESVDNHYQFVGKAALRIEAIEDFFWILTGKNLEPVPAIKANENAPTSPEEMNINYLNESLKLVKSDGERLMIYVKKAIYYEKSAQTSEKLNKLESFKDWKLALQNYDEALNIDKKNHEAGIGRARCLINLCKFKKTIGHLEESQYLNSIPEFWLYLSVAYMKEKDYDKAQHMITQALSGPAPHNPAIIKQNKIIERIQRSPLETKMAIYQQGKIEISEEFFNKRNDPKQTYNILSIDGGGVRGIIPALWLCEIEKQTRRPISHLFNMVAGTSIGAVLASSLSVPKQEYVSLPEGGVHTRNSDFIPMYSAYDAYALFKRRSSEIFSSGSKSFIDAIFGTNLSTDKYSDVGRKKVFQEYLQSLTLNEALTDIVISAINTNDMSNTHLFSGLSSKRDTSLNVSLVDAAMASTAAPTFFPPYKINGEAYLDGGIHINNPAMAAYTEALRYQSNKENIFVLSLGTGSYIFDPFNPELSQGQLFWAQNFHKVALAAQECNVDKQMFQYLGNKYERFQIYFDRPIALDDYESIDYLSELGTQYIEELYASEDNRMNKLIEYLVGNEWTSHLAKQN